MAINPCFIKIGAHALVRRQAVGARCFGMNA
jgi:hypothetical protein